MFVHLRTRTTEYSGVKFTLAPRRSIALCYVCYIATSATASRRSFFTHYFYCDIVRLVQGYRWSFYSIAPLTSYSEQSNRYSSRTQASRSEKIIFNLGILLLQWRHCRLFSGESNLSKKVAGSVWTTKRVLLAGSLSNTVVLLGVVHWLKAPLMK